MEFQHISPYDIEKTSFKMIRKELAEMGKHIPEEAAPIVYRCIHTTADFDYADTLAFSDDAVEAAKDILGAGGAHIVTDTNMALMGINSAALQRCSAEKRCFMADPDVAREAKARGITRAAVSMEHAAALCVPTIFAIGNAPTALIKLRELIDTGFRPELVIGVPVGFVNVVEAKELIMETDVPWIVNRGRKGGSGVAAAICNALLYMVSPREEFCAGE